MSTLISIAPNRSAAAISARHPLEPLSADEVRTCVELLKQNGKVTPITRFVSVALKEPPKSRVYESNGEQPPREAFAVLFDNATNSCFEATISLADEALIGCK